MHQQSKKKGKTGRRWQTTSQWNQWDKEVRGVKGFIKRLVTSKSMGGEKWRTSMLKHYRARLNELVDAEPTKYR